jgi:hypothetical protein
LNQVEIYFSVVQYKVASPNDFPDLAEVGDGLRAFEGRYNAAAQPFQWRFTISDLDDLLTMLDGTPPITTKYPPSRWQHDHTRRTYGADHLA